MLFPRWYRNKIGDSAFSLIGILMSILLLSIAWGGVTHVSNRMLERRALRHVSKLISQALIKGHEKGLYMGSPVSAFSDTSKGIFNVKSRSFETKIPLPEKHLKNLQVYSGFSSADRVPEVRFLPNGYSSPARIELRGNHYQCRIQISLRGRITRFCEGLNNE